MSNDLQRILPPYTRRLDTLRHRLLKAATITSILVFSVVMGFWVAIFSTFVLPLFLGFIGLLFLIAMWMSDDSEPDLNGAGGKLMTAFMALFVVWPGYLAIAIPGLPWITPTRLALFGMALILLLQTAQSKRARDQINGAIAGVKPAFIAYAIFQFCMLATSVAAASASTALGDGIQQLILWNIPLLAALWLFQDPDKVDRTFRAILFALLIVLLFTLAEFREKLPIWIPYIPSFLKVDAPQMTSVLSSQMRFDEYRARGTYGVHLYYSQFLLLMLPFAIHWTLDSETGKRRAFAIAFLVLMLVVIWMNNTRTATTGQLIVAAGMLGIFALRHYLHTKSGLDMTAPAIAVGIPGLAGVGAILIAISPRLKSMTLGGTGTAGSDAVRDLQWSRAWSAVASNPFGYGAGGSGPLTGRMSNGIWIVDSTWINLMVDYGVIAALAWIAFLGFIAGVGILIYLQRADRTADLAGPAAVGIGSVAMSMYTISFWGNFTYLMILIGLVAATRNRLAVAGKLASPKEIFRRTTSLPTGVGASTVRG